MAKTYTEHQEMLLERESKNCKLQKSYEKRLYYSFFFFIIFFALFYKFHVIGAEYASQEAKLAKQRVTWQCRHCKAWNITDHVLPLRCQKCGKIQGY